MTCLAFSPDGQLLAAGGAEGCTRVWELRDARGTSQTGLMATGSVTVPSTAGGGAVGAVRWLPSSNGWVLLTGNHNNAALKLWHSTGIGGSWRELQRFLLEGTPGQREVYNNVDVVAARRLVVLADAAHNMVYTLHYSGEQAWAAQRVVWTKPAVVSTCCPPAAGEGADLRFDYVARFGVAVPILSFATLWNPSGGEGNQHVELNCVQTTAVQQYSLDPALCCAAVGDAAGRQRLAETWAQLRCKPLGLVNALISCVSLLQRTPGRSLVLSLASKRKPLGLLCGCNQTSLRLAWLQRAMREARWWGWWQTWKQP